MCAHVCVYERACMRSFLQYFLFSNAGCSRSVTIALAYVIEKEKISLEEALRRLKETRPSAKPNDGFMKQLKQWEQSTMS